MQEGGKGEKRNFNDASSDGLAKIAKKNTRTKTRTKPKTKQKKPCP